MVKNCVSIAYKFRKINSFSRTRKGKNELIWKRAKLKKKKKNGVTAGSFDNHWQIAE